MSSPPAQVMPQYWFLPVKDKLTPSVQYHTQESRVLLPLPGQDHDFPKGEGKGSAYTAAGGGTGVKNICIAARDGDRTLPQRLGLAPGEVPSIPHPRVDVYCSAGEPAQCHHLLPSRPTPWPSLTASSPSAAISQRWVLTQESSHMAILMTSGLSVLMLY